MTVEQMDEVIIENWNSVVNRKDLVYILGDFAWKNHSSYLHKLNGSKILIKGNHDFMNQKTLSLFREVTPLKDIKIEKVKVTLCHYAMMSWNCSFHGSWALYGHSHGNLSHPGLAMDVGVDCNNYTPVSWVQVKEKMCDKADKLLFEYNPELIGWKRIEPNYGIGIFKIEKGLIEVRPAHGTQFNDQIYPLNIIKDHEDGTVYVNWCGQNHELNDFIWAEGKENSSFIKEIKLEK